MTGRKSRFSGLFEADAEGDNTEEQGAAEQSAEPEQAPPAPPPTESKRRRSTGKRSDPRYKPTTVYLLVDLHRRAHLQQFGTDEDVSDLINQALAAYLDAKNEE